MSKSHVKHSREEHETKMGDCDCGGADMAVELEAGLNADSHCDPTSEFVTQGEKKGTGHVWTCKCCQRMFNGHKHNASSQCTLLA